MLTELIASFLMTVTPIKGKNIQHVNYQALKSPKQIEWNIPTSPTTLEDSVQVEAYNLYTSLRDLVPEVKDPLMKGYNPKTGFINAQITTKNNLSRGNLSFYDKEQKSLYEISLSNLGLKSLEANRPEINILINGTSTDRYPCEAPHIRIVDNFPFGFGESFAVAMYNAPLRSSLVTNGKVNLSYKGDLEMERKLELEILKKATEILESERIIRTFELMSKETNFDLGSFGSAMDGGTIYKQTDIDFNDYSSLRLALNEARKATCSYNNVNWGPLSSQADQDSIKKYFSLIDANMAVARQDRDTTKTDSLFSVIGSYELEVERLYRKFSVPSDILQNSFEHERDWLKSVKEAIYRFRRSSK